MKKKVGKKAAGKTAAVKKTSKKTGQEARGIKKQYLKSSPACRVTFKLPKAAAEGADRVTIAGDFNGWDKKATPMKRLKNGDFTVTLELESGVEYRFRYLIDNARWENDWCADKYIHNPHGGDDSVVIV